MPAALQLMSEGSLSNTCIFSVRDNIAFLGLEINARHHFTPMPGGQFKQQSHQWKAQKYKKHGEMEQDPMVFAPQVLSLPFVCGKTLAKE